MNSEIKLPVIKAAQRVSSDVPPRFGRGRIDEGSGIDIPSARHSESPNRVGIDPDRFSGNPVGPLRVVDSSGAYREGAGVDGEGRRTMRAKDAVHCPAT